VKISIEHDARRCFKEELRIKYDESIWFIPLLAGSKTLTSKFGGSPAARKRPIDEG